MSITLLMKWQMLQTIFKHPGLSSSAKVIAGRLLDHLNTQTGQCNPSYSRLAEATGLSRDTAMAAVHQLEEANVVKVTRSVADGRQAQPGQMLPSNSFAFDFGTPNQSENPTTPSRKTRPPQSENPTTLVDKTDHPQSENSARGSRKSRPKTKKEETGNKETGNGIRITDEEFDQFWMQYPKRVSKGSARKAFDKALGKAPFEQIMAGVHRYAAERIDQDPKFTKHASTWLANDCWLDEPQPPRPMNRVESVIFGLFSGIPEEELPASRRTAREGLLGDLTPEDFVVPSSNRR